MVRPIPSEEDRVVETWESAIAGTVYVWVYDRREDKYIKQAVGGRTASKRLHITRDDRKYNQEQIPIENAKHDPFTNGSLRLIAASTRDESLDTRYHYTDAELVDLLDMRDPANFQEAIEGIESELILRRLASLAETQGTMAQLESLKELLHNRWPVGGTQRAVREMIEAGERIGANRI